MRKEVIYVARDGTKFSDAKECARHERVLELIPIIEADPNYSDNMSTRDIAAIFYNLRPNGPSRATLTSHLLAAVDETPGRVFCAKDLEYMGNLPDIRSLLCRLVLQGKVRKIDKGRYTSFKTKEEGNDDKR